jgi:hypothetical protein
MEKLAFTLMLAFAVIGGTAAVFTLATTPVAACPSGTPGC